MCPTFWGWLTSRSGRCGDNYRFALFRTADVEKPDVACEPRHPKNTLGLAIGDVQKREYRIRGRFLSPAADSTKISGRSASEITISAAGAFVIRSLCMASRNSFIHEVHGYAPTRQIRRNQSFNRSRCSLGSLAQGPDVGESVRSVKYCFARPCFTRGSRSVPMYSARKSRSPSTFGVSRDDPENSAHNVIGSGFHSGRIGTSLLRLSGCFAIHSGRTVMPRPSRANGRLMPGSLVTT
jgi:hypothetical protein